MSQTLNSFIKMKKCASPLQPHTAVHLKYLTAARQLSFSIQKPPLYTRTAPNLFLTKTTKLTSHGTSRCPASPLTLYGRLRQLYTRRNQRAFCVFGRLWKFVLPEVRSSHRRRFVASTSCHLLIFFARNFVKFVKCVYSRGPCVRGVCGSAGRAEGRESMGVWLLLTSLFFVFR